MSKIQACTTMAQFVKEWDRKLDHIITSFGLGESTEDVKQDIYEAMCVPDPETGKNGLEKYDPARSSFSTYVYAMVLTKARNAKAKKIRENSMIQLQNFHANEDDDESLSNWSRDRIEARSAILTGQRSEKDRVEFRLQLKDVFNVLRTYTPRSDFFRNGEVIVRDLTTLLQLILEGKSREEIVTYFEYSTGSVGVMYESLRSVKELQELCDMVYGST